MPPGFVDETAILYHGGILLGTACPEDREGPADESNKSNLDVKVRETGGQPSIEYLTVLNKIRASKPALVETELMLWAWDIESIPHSLN